LNAYKLDFRRSNLVENQMEIICIGNELLIGKTLNTNENWLAKRATSLGITVKRTSTVGDEIQEIAKVIYEALKRKPRFIIMTGGLGPTYDDKTLEGVAESLNQKLVVNESAFQMVKKKYETYFREGRMEKVELTPSRIKMATIPERAMPLPNPVGTAPGVKLDANGTILFVLPGVPSEMKAIFDESVAPIMIEEVGDLKFFEKSLFIEGIMESSLAPLIDQVIQENPYVYIKSHPKGEERIHHIEVHLSTMGINSDIAEKRLEKTRSQIQKLIEEQ
jgi:molybdenum cofactor synthesis domain-containing protein